MMEFFELARGRFSVRSYASTPVTDEQLQTILELTSSAPSAGNLQAYEVVVVRDKERRAALAKAALGQSFIADAPLALVFFTHPQRSSGRYGERGAGLYACQDATIAATYAMLGAHALGLGTVWVGAFDDEGVSAAVGAPEDHQPVALLPIGVPSEPPRQTPRRKLDDIIHQETY